MAFFKKKEENEQAEVKEESKRSIGQKLEPLSDIGRFAIEQKDKLQDEESVTIEGIDDIGNCFNWELF